MSITTWQSISLFSLLFAAAVWWMAVQEQNVVIKYADKLNHALAGWRYSQEHWEECIDLWSQNMDRHNAYEAALRRELATLRARKQNEKLWGKYDADEFYVWCPEARMDKWRFDRRPESNWGKYLQREKGVRGA